MLGGATVYMENETKQYEDFLYQEPVSGMAQVAMNILQKIFQHAQRPKATCAMLETGSEFE